MQEMVYTLGVWRVKPGQEAEFIAAWKALGEIFAGLEHPPAGTGTLIQSVSDPALFYSFGPWNRLEDIQEMRNNPQAQAGIQRVVDLCTEATPGTFRLVAESPAHSEQIR
jgi:heme-degrading monooxygenase HmoA